MCLLPLRPLHSPVWLRMGHHESLSRPDQVLFPQAWDGHGGDAGDHHGQGKDADVRMGAGLLPPCLRGHQWNPWWQPTQQQGPRPAGATQVRSSASGAAILPAQALWLPHGEFLAVSAVFLLPQCLPASPPRAAPGFRHCQGWAPGLGSRCHLLSFLAQWA